MRFHLIFSFLPALLVAVSVFPAQVRAESASLPPLVCAAGGPIGSVDLRVAAPLAGGEALPLRTINRLGEGDKLLYRPILRSSEERKGDVTLVLVPANPTATGRKLLILDPKPANKPEEWDVPWRVSVAAFVYGPSGLNTRKVKDFLSRDDTLIAALADYAEKTAQTEALIAALSSPNTSSAAVQSALQGFSSQYGLGTQIDRTAPTNQQAMVMFRTLNPAIAGYDPISPQGTQQLGQTASLATSVATLFFGSPVGLAAGGTAMLLELRSVAFPRTEFRSSFSQSMPNEALGLCGRRDAAPTHTKVAYLWASRVPNVGPPQLSIEKASSLPASTKSPLPVTVSDADWKVVDRARSWAVQPEGGKPIPIKVQKLGDTKMLEIELGPAVKPGKYTLLANWDWDRFQAKGQIDVRPLADFVPARLVPSSQDLLVAKMGKVPVTLEGSDFEFVSKVEIEKLNDEFASPAPVPFVLPKGLRQGPQERMDVQVNTAELDPGSYKLLISQVDGKAHPVDVKILPSPPRIENLPVLLNQGATSAEFVLRGQALDLLRRLEVAGGTADLGAASPDRTARKLTLHVPGGLSAGKSLSIQAYAQDRSEPLIFSDAVRIVGPRPVIADATVPMPPDLDVALEPGEIPGGVYLSALMHVENLRSNSVVKLGCGPEQPGAAVVMLHLGEHSGPLSLQQLAPNQVYLSFDTGAWVTGCVLQATVANGNEGESELYKLGRIVRVPKIESMEIQTGTVGDGGFRAVLTGRDLDTIEKAGWGETEAVALAGLPLPVEGDAQKQRLEILLPLSPDAHAVLHVWLRGELKPRTTRVHS